MFAVGAGAGGTPTVKVFGTDGTLKTTITAFEEAFAGGVRVAVANDSGDLVAAPGPGREPTVKVFDSATGALKATLPSFEATFTGGVNVAVGDLTGDGVDDIVISADTGGGPRVRVFDGNGYSLVADFWGIDDPNFRGGARVAVGDVDGDGRADLIVAAGFGGGPRVAVYDGRSIVGGQPQRMVADFFAFEPALRNGAYVTAGDVTGDGKADLVFGGGPGGAPRVLVVDAAAGMMAGAFGGDGGPRGVVANFFAGDARDRGGLRVAARDLDGDGRADLVTGSGGGRATNARVYTAAGVAAASSDPAAAVDLDPFGEVLAGGVYVG